MPALREGTAARALLVRSTFNDGDLGRRLGRAGYSYRYVYRAFAPLLDRWGRTTEISGPPHEVEQAAARARRQGLDPLHLSFLPLHQMSPASGVPNVAAISWEYPEVPGTDVGGDARNNWVRTAGACDRILAHTHYARDAFVRSGVRTPVDMIPIPIHPDYFAVDCWQPGRRTVLDCPCYVFPQPTGAAAPPPPSDDPAAGSRWHRLSKRALALVPGKPGKKLRQAVYAARVGLRAARSTLRQQDIRDLFPARPHLELLGVVYTAVFNPFDGRKNWVDLLEGFLVALGDCADAQLVVKLVVAPEKEADALAEAYRCYRRATTGHRCRVVFVTAFLSDGQLVGLARASTYYLNTSRAEGSCLPLQGFLAAGRPAVAPNHTGIADSLDDSCGFVVASHLEPTCWPIDLEGPNTTRWYRLVWQSLHDQIRASYDVARHNPARYRALAEAGRERLRHLAHPESVWPRLAAALDEAAGGKQARRHAG
jgi:glycosyltransferase involved in cell wall biosynthesis